MFDEAAGHNDKLGAPPDGHNLLLTADVGAAPTKRAEGEYDEMLIIEQGKTFDNAIVRAELGGEQIRLTRAEDINWALPAPLPKRRRRRPSRTPMCAIGTTCQPPRTIVGETIP